MALSVFDLERSQNAERMLLSFEKLIPLVTGKVLVKLQKEKGDTMTQFGQIMIVFLNILSNFQVL